MLAPYSLLLSAVAVTAHYTFANLHAGSATSAWQYVRKTVDWQDNGFVADVTSDKIRCNELSPGSTATQTYNVTAGSTLGFDAQPNVYHPGPVQFYMAKVPAGQTAATWDGSGAVWFKIYEEQPTFGSTLSWPSMNKATVSTTIPKCIPSGEYLYRVEHIALHSASSSGGAQFYFSCGQISVSGGGSTTPTNLVSFPGAYKATDPGILINIYYPVPTSYTNPGPAVFKC